MEVAINEARWAILKFLIVLGSFGRRASDGGANLHIYYPTTSSTGQNMVADECLHGDFGNNTVTMEGNDESNDEIKRCESRSHLFSLTIHSN